MSSDEISELRDRLASYERNARKSSWLIRQLSDKIRHFPRDVLRRFRRSIQKRMATKPASVIPLQFVGLEKSLALIGLAKIEPLPFIMHGQYEQIMGRSKVAADSSVAAMREFLGSAKMHELFCKAAALDPDIGSLANSGDAYCPPWHDLDYLALRHATDLIPRGPYGSVVIMPAGRMGGADLVAAVLARALAAKERVLILRTDDTYWDRPDWYPEHVVSVDISTILRSFSNPNRALYIILCEIGAARVFNVNSRRAFETFVSHGKRLSTQFNLYAYYFCADRSLQGIEEGYPVWYFSNIFPYLTAALFDTKDLAQTLIDRYAIPFSEIGKIRTIYTPSQLGVPDTSLAAQQVHNRGARRPCILWAGRLDRQKWFDMALAVAKAMPDIDFQCWGKAVLDAQPNLSDLPANLTLNPSFNSYDELPLTACDGWLYTSLWDGLPTILIELGALGMPIVANAVGGVPELIDETTGWIFDPSEGVEGAVTAIRTMLGDPSARVQRATALQARVRRRHSMESYTEQLGAI